MRPVFRAFDGYDRVRCPKAGVPLRCRRGDCRMLELTEEQIRATENPAATPPRLVNPRTKATFVLLPVGEYERLREGEYDDSPWTREELQALAWETVNRAAGPGADEEDDAAEKP